MRPARAHATRSAGALPLHKKWPVFPAIRGIGGAEGDRTLDLCIANAALSQLSYRPMCDVLRRYLPTIYYSNFFVPTI